MCIYGEYGICSMCPQDYCPYYGEIKMNKIQNDNRLFNNNIKNIENEKISCPITPPYIFISHFSAEKNEYQFTFNKTTPFEINSAATGIIEFIEYGEKIKISTKTQHGITIIYSLDKIAPNLAAGEKIINCQYLGDSINTAEVIIQ